MKKVSIIGLGYVGLPLALAIERSQKYEVVGFDISKEQVKKILSKECPITDELAERDLNELDLHATTDSDELKDTDIFIICVPTPVLDDYTPDYTPVISAGKTISTYLKKGATVVLESTVNPGTCEEILVPVLEKEVDWLQVKILMSLCVQRELILVTLSGMSTIFLEILVV